MGKFEHDPNCAIKDGNSICTCGIAAQNIFPSESNSDLLKKIKELEQKLDEANELKDLAMRTARSTAAWVGKADNDRLQVALDNAEVMRQIAEKERDSFCVKSETWQEVSEAQRQSSSNLAIYADDDSKFNLPISGIDIVTRDVIKDLRELIKELEDELAIAKSNKIESVKKFEEWLKDCESYDIKTFSNQATTQLAENLKSVRIYSPTACHALINAAVDRLLKENER